MKIEFKKKELNKCVAALVKADGRGDIAANAVFREIPWITKAAVSGTEHSDLVGSYVSYTGGQFSAYLEHGGGAFEYILQRARKAAFNQRMFIPAASIDGQVVAENSAIPVGAYSLSGSALTPQKVAAISVVSNESLEPGGDGIDWLLAELRQGIIKGTDTKALIILRAACTPGSATASPTADIKTLLDSVNKFGFNDLAFILPPALANYLSTKTGTGGNLLFPDLGPNGGILCGTPAVVSAGQIADEITLVDCNGLVAGAQDVEISLAHSAMVEMDSSPQGDSQVPTDASTDKVSCFQVEATAAKAVRSFGLSVPRASAVAVIKDIAWS